MNFLTFAAELKILSEKLKLRSKTFKETTEFELEIRKQRKMNARWPIIQRKKKFVALLYPKKVLKSFNKSVPWRVFLYSGIWSLFSCQAKVDFWRQRYFWKFRKSKSFLWHTKPIETPIQTPIMATNPRVEYSRISVLVGLFGIARSNPCAIRFGEFTASIKSVKMMFDDYNDETLEQFHPSSFQSHYHPCF